MDICIKGYSKNKLWVSKIFFFLNKWHSKNMYNVPKLYISNKCFIIMVSSKILSSTTAFNIDSNNVSWAENQHIRMISEGSCDTEDWSNDAENSALPSQE